MSGSRPHTVPEVARLLGISKRGVRDRIERSRLGAVMEDKRWIGLLPPDVPDENRFLSVEGNYRIHGSWRWWER